MSGILAFLVPSSSFRVLALRAAAAEWVTLVTGSSETGRFSSVKVSGARMVRRFQVRWAAADLEHFCWFDDASLSVVGRGRESTIVWASLSN
ncbi:hypothetical protein ACFY5D_21130 [Paeniglutamicibacter sp. NPDC012692]|uniref:hypothetical protein n=1 Tax=Paeniglutamicibacter sp. NPDC012692 TaxID=3364388 RepID=UPI0036C87BDA